MSAGIKKTLIICLTILIGICLLQFGQYIDRYALLATKDSIYIFDKIYRVLNKCDGDKCSLLEIKQPGFFNALLEETFRARNLEDEKSMVSEVSKKIDIKEIEPKSSIGQVSSNSEKLKKEKEDYASKLQDKEKKEDVKIEKEKVDEEFVE
jgi:hypothetical protein